MKKFRCQRAPCCSLPLDARSGRLISREAFPGRPRRGGVGRALTPFAPTIDAVWSGFFHARSRAVSASARLPFAGGGLAAGAGGLWVTE